MADVTLKIDADTAGYIAKIARMAEAHERANKHLETQGSLADKVATAVERSVFKAIALRDVASEIANAFKNAADKAAELSKQSGGNAVQLGTSLLNLGIRGKVADATITQIQQSPSNSTPEAQTALLEALSSINNQRRDRRMPLITQRQVFDSLQALRQYGEAGVGAGASGLLQAFDEEHGLGMGVDIAKHAKGIASDRIGPDGLPISVQNEIALRQQEQAEKAKQIQIAQANGGKVRMGNARVDSAMMDHPFWAGVLGATDTASYGVTGQIFRYLEGEGVHGSSGNAEPWNNSGPEIKRIERRDRAERSRSALNGIELYAQMAKTLYNVGVQIERKSLRTDAHDDRGRK